jgi:hypothetical protein
MLRHDSMLHLNNNVGNSASNSAYNNAENSVSNKITNNANYDFEYDYSDNYNNLEIIDDNVNVVSFRPRENKRFNPDSY